jgi:hypothetical protein
MNEFNTDLELLGFTRESVVKKEEHYYLKSYLF